MSNVSKDALIEIQCYVADKDIADLRFGKEAMIKLEAYPYSKYGILFGACNRSVEK